MLDEFIYQYQTFCHQRTKMDSDDQKIGIWAEFFESGEQYWTLESVIGVLEKFV